MSENTSISLFGITMPLPHWTLSAFGVIAVCGVAGFVYQQLYRPAPDLINIKQANRQLQAEVSEYGVHMGDLPTSTYVDPDGAFTLKTFADNCVVIIRKIGRRTLTKLVLDLDRLANLETDADTHALASASENPLVQAIMPRLAAAGQCHVGAHEGQFTTKYGSRDGCWVQVWRTFEDGCQHYQMFNSCGGFWDTNPDGSPKVSWTHCVH